MGSTPFRTLVASITLVLCPFAAAAGFHLQEATIADIHRAILAKELTATELVGLYLKRIDAYNGRCVSGASVYRQFSARAPDWPEPSGECLLSDCSTRPDSVYSVFPAARRVEHTCQHIRT
jgi:hypothetical protein